MGMLVDGQWLERDEFIDAGAYRRVPGVLADAMSEAYVRALRDEPGRFHLVASLSCPWSHRTMIVHALKGLARTVPVHIAGGPRTRGYGLDGGRPWRVPGTGRCMVHLHELYAFADPAYCGRATVPVLWDSRDRRIVSNDSGTIMRAFDRAPPGPDAAAFTLVPEPLRARIDALDAELYDTLNNAVYEAGFATAQATYDAAVAKVFGALGRLEARLCAHRYLFGNTVTQSDWRLFATLVRFDAVYAVLFKCCLRRLVDHASLWAYARDLYAWRGVAATVDFETMRVQSYLNDQPVEHPIVAIMPDVDWRQPHGRERLGPARVALLDGAQADVDPASLEML